MKSNKIESPKSQTMLTLEDQSDLIIYTSKDGGANVALMTREGRVWLTQKQMAENEMELALRDVEKEIKLNR